MTYQRSFHASLLASVLTLLSACSQPTSDASAPLPAEASANAPVYMFNTLPVSADAQTAFLDAMRENVRGSRAEAGNISFDAFVDEEGQNSHVYLFERWSDQAALNAHMKTPHLQAVAERAASALSSPEVSLKLTEIAPETASTHAPLADPATSRNIVVVFDIKPEARQTFLDALAEVIPQARQAPGNHTFELYQVLDKENTFVLYERWTDIASHEAHLGQPYSLKLDGIVPGTLAAPIQRHLLTDVVAD